MRLEAGGIDYPDRKASDYLNDAYSGKLNERGQTVSEAVLAKADKDLSRLIAGEPLAYVTGKAHFYGLALSVNKHVLIPRPETEELVRWILEDEPDTARHFIDLCTGSGCIAAALAQQRPTWRGLAVDVSKQALAVATKNFELSGVAQQVNTERHDVTTEEDYLGEGGEWDIIVANPPYIPDSDWARVDPSVEAFEPHLALRVSDAAPLSFYQAIEHTARHHLSFGGALYFECNDKYASDVAKLLEFEGWGSVEIFTDMQGKPRHVRGRAG